MRGILKYPLKIIDKTSGDFVILLPEDLAGFSAIEVKANKPHRIFYSFDDVKWHVYLWNGGYNIIFDPPLSESDIQEGLRKKIINNDEAILLRTENWDAFYENINEENMQLKWNAQQEHTYDLYMKLASELEFSRKVIFMNK